MSIEEIPSDQVFDMSELFHRSFKAAGCDPACHCCYKFIPVGEKFKLSTIREVRVDMSHTSNTSETAFAQDRLKVIKGDLIKSPSIIDETKEVMLCKKCTSGLFHKKQLDAAHISSDLAKKYYQRGGGCFRVNGKILH